MYIFPFLTAYRYHLILLLTNFHYYTENLRFRDIIPHSTTVATLVKLGQDLVSSSDEHLLLLNVTYTCISEEHTGYNSGF